MWYSESVDPKFISLFILLFVFFYSMFYLLILDHTMPEKFEKGRKFDRYEPRAVSPATRQEFDLQECIHTYQTDQPHFESVDVPFSAFSGVHMVSF